MNTPHPPLGMLAKIGRWLVNFAAMPGLIRELAANAEALSDGRVRCRSCQGGRIGNLKLTKVEPRDLYGVCDQCGVCWGLTRDAGAISRMIPMIHVEP